MAKTIEQILHFENLTGLIKNPVNTVPANVLPPAFTTRGRSFSGKTCQWNKISANRKTARLVQYGSPSVQRNMAGVSSQTAVMMHTFEHILHDPAVLVQLQNYDNPAQQALGEAEIVRQTDDFNALFENLLLSSVYSALRYGAIYFDASGNLLPTSSGAATTIDFSVPAGNQSQLDIDGDGDIIAASWATASTNIISQLVDLKSRSLKLSGYIPKHAFYGSSIPSYFAANTQIQALLQSRSDMSAQFQNGEIPPIAGIQFHPAYDAFFEDANGTNSSWWPADLVVFTDDPSPDWWEIFSGSYPVPTDLGRIGDSASSVKPAEKFGRFSYAKQLDDPCTVKHCAGDTFLPVIKVPKSVFIADVAF